MHPSLLLLFIFKALRSFGTTDLGSVVPIRRVEASFKINSMRGLSAAVAESEAVGKLEDGHVGV